MPRVGFTSPLILSRLGSNESHLPRIMSLRGSHPSSDLALPRKHLKDPSLVRSRAHRITTRKGCLLGEPWLRRPSSQGSSGLFGLQSSTASHSCPSTLYACPAAARSLALPQSLTTPPPVRCHHRTCRHAASATQPSIQALLPTPSPTCNPALRSARVPGPSLARTSFIAVLTVWSG